VTNSTSVSVRRANPGDSTSIARVHVRAWQEAYAHLVPAEKLASLDVAARAASWERILGDGTTEVWVAEVAQPGGAEVVGWASAGPGRGNNAPRALEVEGIYVLAAHHGSGAGQALCDAAIGASEAFLWMAADNPRAEHFYRRNGFEPDGATDRYLMLGTHVDIVRLVR
jgi:L-amino acid N-acyltransferase YncA